MAMNDFHFYGTHNQRLRTGDKQRPVFSLSIRKCVGHVDEKQTCTYVTWSSGELWWYYVPGARFYVRRRHWRGYKEYTKADIDRAIELVHNGASLVEAEKATRVPDASIRRFLKKCTAHPGPCKGANLRQGSYLQSAQSAGPFATRPGSSGENALQSWCEPGGLIVCRCAVRSRASATALSAGAQLSDALVQRCCVSTCSLVTCACSRACAPPVHIPTRSLLCVCVAALSAGRTCSSPPPPPPPPPPLFFFFNLWNITVIWTCR